MRAKVRQQTSIVEPAVNHPHASELQMMDRLLSLRPEIVDLVYEDLIRGLDDPDAGREGMMTAEQVFKAMTIKQMNGYSYQELAFHLEDSRSYRAYCGFGIADEVPTSSTLQRDIKKLRPETLEAINRVLLDVAVDNKLEKGRKARVDCTVVESNIHHPTDSSLLSDSVRVLSRLTRRAKEVFDLELHFVDHCRRARKRDLEILNATKDQQRQRPYRDLLRLTRFSVGYANEAVRALRLHGAASPHPFVQQAADNAAQELENYVSLALQVISQTERRVLHGEKVPAEEKVVSIFEPHSDILVKDRRETYYGHKVTLTGGASGLVLDLVVEEGNPADSTLAVGMIQRQRDIYGRVPRQAAFDGGFASKANLADIKNMGVKDVSFHKKRGLKISDMAKSTWVYKRLRNFRAGIEGMVSFLKRGFGLRRCTWRGFESFKSYAWASVVTANLLVMARHLLA
jgi:IS5 family transposase